ncbi:MAG: thioredoxin domain-containing protein [Betaproteobacteria bacterium]|nr:thioredoxin domain-containing protein [Betaproteobacteria bacterium]
MNRLAGPLLYIVLALSSTVCAAESIPWQPWSEAVFEQARKEHRFVLLDLEAVWCHWCHVMEEQTYHDDAVIKLIRDRYIAVRVDQDARPDLSRRYEDYGWPATIVFAADGKEIVKRSGYVPPPRFASLLEAIVKDPTPVKYRDSEQPKQYSTSPLLLEEVRRTLKKSFVDSHDFKLGGLLQQQKFMDRDSVEYALMLARNGDQQARKMAAQTLAGSLNLIDPAWGGVYQYSTDSDWKHPHYEKIMFVQAEHMRLYSLAALALGDRRYLDAAKKIYEYTTGFLLSQDGAFYVSQDADLVKGRHSEDYFALSDADRRSRGMPAIDTHLYARENGWMIQGLAAYYAAGGDTDVRRRAVTAAHWALDKRALPAGGFRHDESAAAGPYLEDTLAMGRGFLALYQITGEREWLRHAENAEHFIHANFAGATAGYVTAAAGSGALAPLPQSDENIMMARFANLLARYAGNDEYRAHAEYAMRFLVTREVALRRRSEAGILIADAELAGSPAHLTIVGAKSDAAAQALFASAQGHPDGYKRIEWWDRAEGPMPNPDVQYPELPRAAAYVCAQNRCSLPVFTGDELLALARRLSK